MTNKIKAEDFIKAFGSGVKEPEHHIITENNDAFPMEIVAGKCPIEAGGNCPLRPQGEWIRTGQSFVNPNKFRNYFCSKCFGELDEHIRIKPNFCPNCGARMRGET